MRLPTLMNKVRSACSPASVSLDNGAAYSPFVDSSEAELLSVFSRRKSSCLESESSPTIKSSIVVNPFSPQLNTVPNTIASTFKVANVVIRRAHEGQKFGLMLGRVNQTIVVLLVRPNSMGADAGVSFGDYIIAIDGDSVTSMTAQQVAQRIVNQQATRLTLQKQPQVTTHIVRFGHGKYCSGLHIRRGTVERVDPNSPASRTGIRTGDVVVRVNSTATVMMADSEIMGLVDRRKKETATLVQTMPRAVFEAYTRGVRDLNALKGGV